MGGEIVDGYYSENDVGVVAKIDGFKHLGTDLFHITWERTGKKTSCSLADWAMHYKIIGKAVVTHPTPFYETLYALVARAVQQGMRAAAEGSRLAQEKGGLAQL